MNYSIIIYIIGMILKINATAQSNNEKLIQKPIFC